MHTVRSPRGTTDRDPVDTGVRFAFGENWSRFLASIDDARIAEAEEALRRMLGAQNLVNRRFLDVGSGSGLPGLAARRLGAVVHSFDYDVDSVACTAELRRRYFPGDSSWTVEQGSVLDTSYMRSLGQFDVVYAWGVLHHTGDMWRALDNARIPLGPRGLLLISIYNDQGGRSVAWRQVKKIYNKLPRRMRTLYAVGLIVLLEATAALGRILTLQPQRHIRGWTCYGRGMSRWHDLVDWVGGYPFEVAKPEQILDFYRDRGLTLCRLKTCGGGLGCNEYVFEVPPRRSRKLAGPGRRAASQPTDGRGHQEQAREPGCGSDDAGSASR